MGAHSGNMLSAVVRSWRQTKDKGVQTERDLCLDVGAILLTDNYDTVLTYMKRFAPYSQYQSWQPPAFALRPPCPPQ